jgi:hypothetical protein
MLVNHWLKQNKKYIDKLERKKIVRNKKRKVSPKLFWGIIVQMGQSRQVWKG